VKIHSAQPGTYGRRSMAIMSKLATSNTLTDLSCDMLTSSAESWLTARPAEPCAVPCAQATGSSADSVILHAWQRRATGKHAVLRKPCMCSASSYSTCCWRERSAQPRRPDHGLVRRGPGGRRRTVDAAQVRAEVLGKLHALGLLLPELQVAVDAARDEEVRLGRDRHVRHGVAVHVAALIHLRARQRVQVHVLVLQHLRWRSQAFRQAVWTARMLHAVPGSPQHSTPASLSRQLVGVTGLWPAAAKAGARVPTGWQDWMYQRGPLAARLSPLRLGQLWAHHVLLSTPLLLLRDGRQGPFPRVLSVCFAVCSLH
jgi:hypothetical protein